MAHINHSTYFAKGSQKRSILKDIANFYTNWKTFLQIWNGLKILLKFFISISY